MEKEKRRMLKMKRAKDLDPRRTGQRVRVALAQYDEGTHLFRAKAGYAALVTVQSVAGCWQAVEEALRRYALDERRGPDAPAR